MNTDYDNLLSQHGVRPTAVRILVYRAIDSIRDTFSLTDLEEKLDSVDKSTIFRTLTTFHEHHIVHKIDDGSGSTKYCMCHNTHVCDIEEMHCHFYCEACHKTFCLEHTHIPVVHCPAGFELKQVSYILKGLCAECSRKLKKNW